MAINLEKKIYSAVAELKNFNIKKSPFAYVWDQDIVIKSRNHLLFTRNSRYADYLTKNEKNSMFYTYKVNNIFPNRKNIEPIFSMEEVIYSRNENKLGFVFLDSERSIETKKFLNEIKDHIDEKTIFFSPILINFDEYEVRALYGIMEFCIEHGKKLEWVCIDGSPRLYEHVDKGFNHAACFKIV
jgi:hypothetical protein